MAGRRLAGALGALLVALLTLPGCGDVPRPFARQGAASPLLADERVLASLRVMPVAGLPGLDAAMAAALSEQQDIIASTDAPGGQAIILEGAAEGGVITWTLVSPERRVIGRVTEPEPAGPPDLPRLASAGALAVSRTLRGAELGLADMAAQPVVIMRPVAAPQGVEGALLADAMVQALQQQGLRLNDGPPAAIVAGRVSVTRGTGDQDLVAVDWQVTDPAGHVLGSMSQGSPVDHIKLTGAFGDLAHDIAAAGAPGLAELIRRTVAPAPAG